MSQKLKAPFRADYVGSFLRPERLKKAREQFAQNEITAEQLTQVEDEVITDLIHKQKELGLQSISDGEFRRSWWHNDFFWGLEGINKVVLPTTYDEFQGIATRHETIELVGKISGKNHPFLEHFRFVKQFEDDEHVAKLTIPSPAQLVTAFHLSEDSEQIYRVYKTNDDFIEGVAAAYREFIQEVYEEGCRYLQFDDPSWGRLCDPRFGDKPEQRKFIAEEKLKVNNLALSEKPEDLVVSTHVCRGNYRSSWNSSGGYAPVAPFVFAKEDIDAFFLEYDTDRAGGFEPLAHVAEGKKVVLGLLTSKFPQLEDKEEIKKRIYEAAQFVPLENLYLSPQCGFASTEEGNVLTEEDQWAKMRLVQEIAKEVWK